MKIPIKSNSKSIISFSLIKRSVFSLSNKLIYYIDLILFGLVILIIITNFIYVCLYLLESLSDFFSYELFSNMSDNNSNVNSKGTEVNYKILNELNKNNSFLSSSDLSALSTNIVDSLVGNLKGILEPVYVSYPTEVLAEQIYGLSILLFILSLIIIIMFIFFIVNIIILVNSDKILNYFTNKYIRTYVKFNKKIIGIEICFLGGILLYALYTLSYGLHFISTHPITLS